MPRPFLSFARRGATLLAALGGFAALGRAQGQCAQAGERDAGSVYPSAKYDGRWTFARISYAQGFGGGGFRGGNREAFWHHDYPKAEQHLSKLVSTLSNVRVRMDASVILSLTDPELFRFPIIYMAEPGRWYPSDAEASALRAYLTKGGFLIFDDFANNDIYNLQSQMTRVLPKMKLVQLGPEHPVFDSFYRVKALNFFHPYYCMKSLFFGIFEDNNPAKRMMAIVNYNNDLGELWEFSDWGYYAVDSSNEAYKLGLNYLIYALEVGLQASRFRRQVVPPPLTSYLSPVPCPLSPDT